jgi:hypothetical protein
MERRERATMRDSSRPSPAFIRSVGDLLKALQASPTPCEACGTGLASRVLTGQATGIVAVCHGCAQRASTPIERRRLRTRVARRT